MKTTLLLYPFQLFPVELIPSEITQILLIEDPLSFGTDAQYPLLIHKQKLVLHRASMQRYMKEILWPAGLEVEYVEFNHLKQSDDIVNYLSHVDNVVFFDPVDDVLQRRIQTSISQLESSPNIQMLDSPSFFLTQKETKDFLGNKKKSSFSDFYRWQRERFNILIDQETYKPVGGKLCFDESTKKRLSVDQLAPSFQVFGSNEYVDEAIEYVNKHFAGNPGGLDDFPWPTSHSEAEEWLESFLDTRIDEFSLYEDALDGISPWLYHSGISTMMNIGLLLPDKVITLALDRHAKKEVPIESIESFIRQIVGWREYIRALYTSKHVQMRTGNVFGHNRKITNDWYEGSTGLPPVDDVIKKIIKRGYAHHNERLMIIGNIMLLSDFHPDEVYRYFMEMFVDAYDWIVVPSVYALSQYSDGGEYVDKPMVSTSNYILSLSNYKRGTWADVWDGLYWRFVEKNRALFAKNPRMSLVLTQLDKLDPDRKRIISYRADDFLAAKTTS